MKLSWEPARHQRRSAPISAEAPSRTAEHLHRIRIEISNATIVLAPNVNYDAWTFAGKVPGPFIRVTQGDTVDFTLINRTMMPHSMDFHAAQMAPSKYYVNVMPNDSLHYRFVAPVPVCFCTTAALLPSPRISRTACTAR